MPTSTCLNGTIILLPGMDGTGKLLYPFLETLQNRLTALVVSYPADQHLGYEQLESLVLSKLPRDTDYVLLAESFSGPIAIRIAARNPEGLRGVILVASFVTSPGPRWLRRLPWGLFFRLTIPRFLLRFFLTGGSHGRTPLLSLAIRSAAPGVLASRLYEVLTVDAADALRVCDVPILYIAASRDRLLGKRGLHQVTRGKPDAISIIVGGPHLLLLCNPSEVRNALLPFIDSWLSKE